MTPEDWTPNELCQKSYFSENSCFQITILIKEKMGLEKISEFQTVPVFGGYAIPVGKKFRYVSNLVI